MRGNFTKKKFSFSLTTVVFLAAILLAAWFGTKKQSEPIPLDGTFEVHFIDVGQADAALVACDGKYMLIDAGNREDSDLMYTYLKKYDIKHLDYVIATHVHEDHIGGMGGALNYATPGVIYCPVNSGDSKLFKTIE